MKVTIIAGARPNFMKIAPLMRAIKAAKAAGKNITARLVYTGSDEDKSLEPSLFSPRYPSSLAALEKEKLPSSKLFFSIFTFRV